MNPFDWWSGKQIQAFYVRAPQFTGSPHLGGPSVAGGPKIAGALLVPFSSHPNRGSPESKNRATRMLHPPDPRLAGSFFFFSFFSPGA